MKLTLIFSVVAALAPLAVGCASNGAGARVESVDDIVARLHRTTILVDGHNDFPWRLRTEGNSSFDEIDMSQRLGSGHTDIPRLREGGVGAQFWSVYVPAELDTEGGALRTTLEQIDIVHRMIERYPNDFALASTVDDVERIFADGKIASLIGIEGGYSIENSLGTLRMFYDLGVRYMTLTHADTISWADSATDEAQHDGLTAFGEEVVREMNQLGMLIDLSHVSDATMRDALRISTAPVIFSHSSARSVADHPRNVSDDILRLVKKNGGVVMVNFFPGFVVPESALLMHEMFSVIRRLRAESEDDDAFDAAFGEWQAANPIEPGDIAIVADHIDHIVKVAGIDHVGLGSDFDGIPITPVGLEDVSTYPALTKELLERGYSEEDLRRVLGSNALRALRGAERAARE